MPPAMLALSLLLAKLQVIRQCSIQLYCTGHGSTCVDRKLKPGDAVNNLAVMVEVFHIHIDVYRCLVFWIKLSIY